MADLEYISIIKKEQRNKELLTEKNKLIKEKDEIEKDLLNTKEYLNEMISLMKTDDEYLIKKFIFKEYVFIETLFTLVSFPLIIVAFKIVDFLAIITIPIIIILIYLVTYLLFMKIFSVNFSKDLINKKILEINERYERVIKEYNLLVNKINSKKFDFE